MSERDDEILFNNVYGSVNLPPLKPVTYAALAGLDEYYRIRNKEIAARKASLAQTNIENKCLAREEKRKQEYYQRQLELLYVFAKQRSVLTYRINAAFKLGRVIESNILRSRIILYTEQLELAKLKLSQAIESSQYRREIKPVYLADKEREGEAKEAANAILYDVVFLLSKVESFGKGELREIIKDCAKMISQYLGLETDAKLRPGQIVQRYITDELQLQLSEVCCPVCGENFIGDLKYCLNCGEMRKARWTS